MAVKKIAETWKLEIRAKYKPRLKNDLEVQLHEESNHHKLEKNQNRHHFGQLPWSLKNPDGTHLALGRG